MSWGLYIGHEGIEARNYCVFIYHGLKAVATEIAFDLIFFFIICTDSDSNLFRRLAAAAYQVNTQYD